MLLFSLLVILFCVMGLTWFLYRRSEARLMRQIRALDRRVIVMRRYTRMR